MSREIHFYLNEGVTARVLIDRQADHYDLDVWISRRDLFQADPMADEWVQHEILPRCIHPGSSRTIRVSGPNFKNPPIHIIE